MSTSSITRASFFSLYPGAEACIQNMHLDPSKQEIVRDCIFRYSTSHTFCDVLKWIVFRVNSLFKGRNSEWNTTKKMVQNHVMEVAIQQGLIQRNPQSNLEKEIRDYFAGFANLFVDESFNLCFFAQNGRVPLQDRLQQNLQRTDLFYSINMVKNKIDAIRARALNPSSQL